MPKYKISTAARAKLFYDFCDMRLKGQSDVTYRAYDLLRPHNPHVLERPFEWMVKHCGLFWPMGGKREVTVMLQRHFENRGHGIVSLPMIEKLIREYYIYSKIRYESMKWATRDPDEALMLHKQHEYSTILEG